MGSKREARLNHKLHKCPRCQEKTTRKCYCDACLVVLKKPPQAQIHTVTPLQTETRYKGKGI